MTRPIALAIASVMAAAPYTPLSAQAPPARTASLVWQVDGTESGEPFGDLRDYVLLEDGTVWALDFKDQIIRRYNASGAALSIVGRKGSGPGEMRNANGLAVAPDGNVWVNDPANARLSVFAPTGAVQRAVSLPFTGYSYRWEAWFDPSGDLVERMIGANVRFRRLDRDGAVRGTIPYPSCPSGSASMRSYRASSPNGRETIGSYPFSIGGGVAADRRGHFWCAAAQGTRVARLAYGSTDTVARTSLDIPLVPVSREEREAAIRTVESRLATFATTDFDRAKVPSTKSGIAAIHVDDDGRLWVAHAAPWKRSSTTYDVFDSAGKSLFRLTLPVRGVLHLPVVARGNEFVIAVADADDVISLSKYRLR